METQLEPATASEDGNPAIQNAELQARLETLIADRWRGQDPDARVTSRLRPDAKIDITVVSRLFEGMNGLEREAFFWPVFDPVPKSELIFLTYCLLLTPAEAEQHFSGRPAAPSSPAENWDE